MQIIDFSLYPYSTRHGIYGGMAGDKDGILYNDEYWIIKYPKNMIGMKGIDENNIQYTTSPLSEYIGSHIYEILGKNVHKTLLGKRNNKIVVACKDFCVNRGSLVEIRSIKNAANAQIDEISKEGYSYSITGDVVDLNELETHFKYNPIINKPEIISHFWDMVVIDIFIDNNDRNNGNWGLLYDESTNSYKIAPVYDNGNAFSNKATEEQIKSYLLESNFNRHLGSRTIYCKDEHILSAKKMIKLNKYELHYALLRIVPILQNKMPEIIQMIKDIPNEVDGLKICSKERKDFYIKGLEIRFKELLYPAYEIAKEIYSKNSNNLEENKNNYDDYDDQE